MVRTERRSEKIGGEGLHCYRHKQMRTSLASQRGENEDPGGKLCEVDTQGQSKPIEPTMK